MERQDELLEIYNRIPKDAHCESKPEVQKDVMAACWLYNQLVTDKIQCAVCKWGINKNNIEKYLRGIGKL